MQFAQDPLFGNLCYNKELTQMLQQGNWDECLNKELKRLFDIKLNWNMLQHLIKMFLQHLVEYMSKLLIKAIFLFSAWIASHPLISIVSKLIYPVLFHLPCSQTCVMRLESKSDVCFHAYYAWSKEQQICVCACTLTIHIGLQNRPNHKI